MIIDEYLLNKVTIQARESSRLRKNYNFHATLEDPCQRMLNIMLEGTVFEIHRHTNTAETFVCSKENLILCSIMTKEKRLKGTDLILQ